MEALGGSYTCDDWSAQWQIGDDTWQASLVLDDVDYEDFTLKKNGQSITLDDPNGKNNGTVSGRGFSLEDLEKMLGVTFEINQTTAEVSLVL